MISIDDARLCTDGRYFIQAGKQLEDSTVQLMKMYGPGFYREGSHGIRLENELLVCKDETNELDSSCTWSRSHGFRSTRMP